VIRAAASWDEPHALIGQIHRRWLEMLPVAPSLVPCTLLLAACRPDGDTLLAQLGDGLLAYMVGGRFGVLAPPRSGFGNETDALSVSTTWDDWHVARIKMTVAGDGLVLMSDGVADDLVPARREGFLRLLRGECQRRSQRQSREWLRRQLEHWPTPQHADDKTLAMIFRGPR